MGFMVDDRPSVSFPRHFDGSHFFNPNARQARETCRIYGIPIVRLGRKKELVRVSDIEEALRRFSVRLPKKDAPNGTRITRIQDQQERNAA